MSSNIVEGLPACRRQSGLLSGRRIADGWPDAARSSRRCGPSSIRSTTRSSTTRSSSRMMGAVELLPPWLRSTSRAAFIEAVRRYRPASSVGDLSTRHKRTSSSGSTSPPQLVALAQAFEIAVVVTRSPAKAPAPFAIDGCLDHVQDGLLDVHRRRAPCLRWP